jgi:hypothetical protein
MFVFGFDYTFSSPSFPAASVTAAVLDLSKPAGIVQFYYYHSSSYLSVRSYYEYSHPPSSAALLRSPSSTFSPPLHYSNHH